MERTSICVACEHYGAVPASLSVDPGCRSDDEADALCAPHRARATEGYCVLCGRRAPWVSPWPDSRIGACGTCFAAAFGFTPRPGRVPSSPDRASIELFVPRIPGPGGE